MNYNLKNDPSNVLEIKTDTKKDNKKEAIKASTKVVKHVDPKTKDKDLNKNNLINNTISSYVPTDNNRELSVKDFFSDYNIDINTIKGNLNDFEALNEAKYIIEKDIQGINIIRMQNDLDNIKKNTNFDLDIIGDFNESLNKSDYDDELNK